MVLSNEYLAGLFDSEGCIGAKPTGKSGLTLVLLISNTYLPVLEEVKDTVGYGYFISQKATTSTRKTCFEWRTRDHKHVLDFIGRVKKHARIKREAITNVETIIREHKYKENNGTLRDIDPEILAAYNEIMPLREIGRMLGVHPKSVWKKLGVWSALAISDSKPCGRIDILQESNTTHCRRRHQIMEETEAESSCPRRWRIARS